MIIELAASALVSATVSAAIAYGVHRYNSRALVVLPKPLGIDRSSYPGEMGIGGRPADEPLLPPTGVFSATSAKPHVPWRTRRQELESLHRTKRKDRQEFRA